MKNFRTLSSIFAFSLVLGLMAPSSANAYTFHAPDGEWGTPTSPDGTDGTDAVQSLVLPADPSVTVYGGNGGNGWDDGASSVGSGGDAGASTVSNVFVVSGDVTASVKAMGGDGGMGVGATAAAGAGGTANASLDVTSLDGSTLDLSVEAVGGHGGTAMRGATGGAGADVDLYNGVVGKTFGDLILNQSVTGGAGGNAFDLGSQAGDAGNANSTLERIDTTATSVTINNTAQGGDGGSVGMGGVDATYGGTGEATVWVSTQGTATVLAEAFGGEGGHVGPGSSGDGAIGGYAVSSVTANAYGQVDITQASIGGSGGYSTDGHGGSGGYAAATVDVALMAPSTTDMSSIMLQSIGGGGGYATGVGHQGGEGGSAEMGGFVWINGADESHMFLANADVVGGDGGLGINGADGGGGGDASIESGIGIITNGAYSLRQTAYGGTGGSSDTGFAGVGGDATSAASLFDDTSSDIQLIVSAYGGDGGEGTFGGTSAVGGDAFSYVGLSSLVTGAMLDVQGFAYGGYGAMQGSGHTVVDVEGVGNGTIARASGYAAGSTADVETSSRVWDVDMHSVQTSADAWGEWGQVSAKTITTAGATTFVSETIDDGQSFSTANLALSASPVRTQTTLGTATGTFTVAGEGRMGAVHSYNEGREVYDTTAIFEFSDIADGNTLFFSLTDDALYGLYGDEGFDTAIFSLWQDGLEVFSGEYDTVEAWQAAMALPFSFGEISGSTMIEISMSQITTDPTLGYSFDYVLAFATTDSIGGSYQTATGVVPLPAAAPLFAVAVFGLGALGRRRRA